MAVQVSANNTSVPFIRSGFSLVKESETILTDAGRTAVLVFGTVMAKIAATGKWQPLTVLTGVDGSAVAQGIYIGEDIAAADLVAGDVVNVPILTGGACTVDENQVILDEGTLDIDDVFSSSNAAAVYLVVTIRDLLAQRGIYLEDTINIDEFENA